MAGLEATFGINEPFASQGLGRGRRRPEKLGLQSHFNCVAFMLRLAGAEKGAQVAKKFF